MHKLFHLYSLSSLLEIFYLSCFFTQIKDENETDFLEEQELYLTHFNKDRLKINIYFGLRIKPYL